MTQCRRYLSNTHLQRKHSTAPAKRCAVVAAPCCLPCLFLRPCLICAAMFSSSQQGPTICFDEICTAPCARAALKRLLCRQVYTNHRCCKTSLDHEDVEGVGHECALLSRCHRRPRTRKRPQSRCTRKRAALCVPPSLSAARTSPASSSIDRQRPRRRLAPPLHSVGTAQPALGRRHGYRSTTASERTCYARARQ